MDEPALGLLAERRCGANLDIAKARYINVLYCYICPGEVMSDMGGGQEKVLTEGQSRVVGRLEIPTIEYRIRAGFTCHCHLFCFWFGNSRT